MRGKSVDDTTSSFEIIRRITGDKWKFVILCHLLDGLRRFGELLYQIDSTTKKVLTENLRELEDLGIITRTAHQGNTLKVVYRLTERGELQPIFNELILWSLRYSEERRSELLLFAQQASQWSLSSVKSDVKTLIPVLFGLGALVALVYWMVNNLMDNGENYKKILSNALYAVIVIAIITGLIYAGMNVLLR